MAEVDYKILCETFNGYNPAKRVLVYAEALQLERYELLHHLKDCITPTEKDEFLASVDVWLDKHPKYEGRAVS